VWYEQDLVFIPIKNEGGMMMTFVEPLFLCLELQWKNHLLQSVCTICFPLRSCARYEKVCSLLFGFYSPLVIFLPQLGPVTAVDFSLQSGMLLLVSKTVLSRSRIPAHDFSSLSQGLHQYS
jgi:hypothetical protein